MTGPDFEPLAYEQSRLRRLGLDQQGITLRVSRVAELMRSIVLPGNLRRDLGRVRGSEKESVAAHDRRILEFPLSMSPNAVAKTLRAERWYILKTTVYYIEYRVRRLRAEAERENASADVTIPRPSNPIGYGLQRISRTGDV
jgi:hypothetical protein